MASPKISWRAHWRYLLFIGLMSLAIYVIVPQLKDFRTSWHLLGQLHLSWVVLGVGLTMTTYLAGAGTYLFLALKRIEYFQMVLIQLAAMFVNRLLPAGLGAVGVFYAYLKHKGHSSSQAASIVTVNNTIGIIGHMSVILLSFLIFPRQFLSVNFWQKWSLVRIAVAAVIAIIILIILDQIIGHRRSKRLLAGLRLQLRAQTERPAHLFGALLTSICLTLANIACFGVCALALGIHLPFAAIIIIYSFGISVGTATPTPGGLGGFEAGLFGGLIAYHLGAGPALAVALLYRLVSYWLPLGVGVAAYIVCQQLNLLAF